jgi:hypothetical protein
LVAKRKDTDREKLASCLSYVITTEEHNILMTMNNYFESQGRSVDVLIYDGCLVRRKSGEGVFDEKLLAACEEHIKSTTGYTIKLAIKPLTSSLVFEKEEAQVTNLLDGVVREYGDVKKVFEKNHFKVRNPVCFCEIDDNDKVVMRKEEDFRKLYKNLWVISNDPLNVKGVDLFVDRWIADPKVRTYNKVGLVPPPLTCPKNVFNMWKGFAIDQIECESSGNHQPFVEMLSILCSHVKEELKYLTNHFAHLVQRPGEINGIALTFFGEEGVGKDFFFNQFAKIIGQDYYFETADPEHDLFGKHSNGRLNRMLICIQEGKKKDIFGNRDKFWNFITAKTWNYEQKGIDTIVLPNYCRYDITTNHDVVLPVGIFHL